MSDNISILIKALLEKSSKEQILKEITELQNNINKSPLKIKIDIDNSEFKSFASNIQKLSSSVNDNLKINLDTNNLDEFSQKFVRLPGETYKLTQETKKFKDELGQSIKLINNLDKETGSITKTTQDVTANYKIQRAEIEKINQEQSKYWSNRTKETMTSMVQKPDTLNQMSDYYKNMEVESAKLAVIDEKREQAELSYWSKRRKEATDAITQNNTVLQQMKQYYTQLEKDTALEEKNTQKLREQIALYQKRMSLESQKITGKYGSLVDTKSLETFNSDLKNLSTSTPDVTNKMKYMTLGLKEIEVNAKNSAKALKVAQQDADTFGNVLVKDFYKFSLWFGIGTIFMGVVHEIKNTVAYITTLDNSLNSIRIVTGKTQDQVNSLAVSYNKLAREMSVTTAEIANTSQELYRQGLTDSEVEERMKAIIKYAKISNLSLSESNSIITATVNATGESVQKVIDIFALLGRYCSAA